VEFAGATTESCQHVAPLNLNPPTHTLGHIMTENNNTNLSHSATVGDALDPAARKSVFNSLFTGGLLGNNSNSAAISNSSTIPAQSNANNNNPANPAALNTISTSSSSSSRTNKSGPSKANKQPTIEEFDMLRDQIAEITQAYANSQMKAAELQQDTNSLTKQVEELTQAVTQLKQSNTELDVQLHSAKLQVSFEQIDKITKENVSLKQQAELISEHIQQVTQANMHLHSTHVQMLSEINAEREQREAMEQEFQQIKLMKADWEHKISELEYQLNHTIQEKLTAQAAYEATIQQLNAETEQNKANFASEFQRQSDSFSLELSQLHDILAAVTTERNRYKSTCVSLQKDYAKLYKIASSTTIGEENDKLKEELARKSRSLTNALEALAQLHSAQLENSNGHEERNNNLGHSDIHHHSQENQQLQQDLQEKADQLRAQAAAKELLLERVYELEYQLQIPHKALLFEVDEPAEHRNNNEAGDPQRRAVSRAQIDAESIDNSNVTPGKERSTPPLSSLPTPNDYINKAAELGINLFSPRQSPESSNLSEIQLPALSPAPPHALSELAERRQSTVLATIACNMTALSTGLKSPLRTLPEIKLPGESSSDGAVHGTESRGSKDFTEEKEELTISTGKIKAAKQLKTPGSNGSRKGSGAKIKKLKSPVVPSSPDDWLLAAAAASQEITAAPVEEAVAAENNDNPHENPAEAAATVGSQMEEESQSLDAEGDLP
jgi:hypothetical protein